MTSRNLSKTERIDVHPSSPVKQTLEEAARASHKTVSEFLLDAGVEAAAQALADRRLFELDLAQWQAFRDALDTIRNWEQGKRCPTGAAKALLKILDRAPEAALAALG